MAESKAARVIYWHRTDLRLHDSPALHAALDLSPECLWQIFTWDSHYVYHSRVGPNRWQFLLDCQRDLSASVTKLNPRSKLFVIREAPQTLFPKLLKAWNVTHLVFERDTDAYARERDEEVCKVAKDAGVEVITRTGRTLYDPDAIVKANNNKPTMSITQLRTAASHLPQPPRPLPAPTALPSPGTTSLPFDQTTPTPPTSSSSSSPNHSFTSGLAGPDASFSIPTMPELGFSGASAATTPIRGGETLALSTLRALLSREEWVATFAKPACAPTAVDPPATTVLSPHVHFGSISVRAFWWGVKDSVARWEEEEERKALASGGKRRRRARSGMPVNLEGQLLFREMFFAAQAALGHAFAHAPTNPYCRFIPWHLDPSSSPSSPDDHNPTAETHLHRYRTATTGFPLIDALLRCLITTGYIPHLARHALASFLTRGGCYIHWAHGAALFAELLLDHEPASNLGNWMWVACAAFYGRYERCYSPVAFGKRWDPEGAFVKRWVPELREFPGRWVYEPWGVGRGEQRGWGCVVGGEEEVGVAWYPAPMFEWGERRGVCVRAMKEAYEVGLYGGDERVLDGSWRELFGGDGEGVGGATGGGGGGDGGGRRDGRLDGWLAKGGEGSTGEGGRMAAPGRKRQGGGRGGQGTLDGFVKRSRKN